VADAGSGSGAPGAQGPPVGPRVVLATRNHHKIAELSRILAATGFADGLVGLDAFPGAPDVAETGLTFADNALLKGRAIAAYTGLPTVADDSGLCVDALHGMPGVFSARWSGKHGDDRANLDLVLGQLADVAARGAQFVCAAALVLPARARGGGGSVGCSRSRGGSLMTGGRLAPGDEAPDFTLPDADGKPVTLSALRGQRVIVYFYPAAMTPGCTKEACDFSESLPDLGKAGLTVLGISPDAPAKLRRFREKEHITFPLLSDPERTVLTAYGAYGEKMNYGKKTMGVIRSTFVVGADGKVEKAYYGVKATGHVERLRKELGA